MNVENLKKKIDALVALTAPESITPAVMGNVLTIIADLLNKAAITSGMQFAGVATPGTNPGAPDGNVFYIATEKGTYANFGGITLDGGKLAVLVYDGTWKKQEVDTAGVFRDWLSQFGSNARFVGEVSSDVKFGVDAKADKVQIVAPTLNLIAPDDDPYNVTAATLPGATAQAAGVMTAAQFKDLGNALAKVGFAGNIKFNDPDFYQDVDMAQGWYTLPEGLYTVEGEAFSGLMLITKSATAYQDDGRNVIIDSKPSFFFVGNAKFVTYDKADTDIIKEVAKGDGFSVYTKMEAINDIQMTEFSVSYAITRFGDIGDIIAASVIRPLPYGKLVSSARLGYLTPGRFYLLTDYECTLKGVAASDEKGDNGFDIKGDTPAPFNLLLMAVDKNTLSERCWAVRREGDTYFPETTKFGEWQLWYCLENDTTRFPWADPKGKGLIYRMIDENQLEAPYDFKNVRMKREKFPPGVGGFSPGYYWTFSEKTPEGAVVDASLHDNPQLTNISLRGMASDNGPKADISPANAVILYDFAARNACDHSVIEDSYNLTLGAIRLSEIRHSGHVRVASLFRTTIDRSLNIESGGNLGNMTFSACDGMYLANDKWSGSGRFSDCRNIRGYMNSQTMGNCRNITLPSASGYGGGCVWDTCLDVELTKAPYYSIFRNVQYASGEVTGQMKTVENIAGTSAKKAVLSATGANGMVVTQDSGSAVREFFIGDLNARPLSLPGGRIFSTYINSLNNRLVAVLDIPGLRETDEIRFWRYIRKKNPRSDSMGNKVDRGNSRGWFEMDMINVYTSVDGLAESLSYATKLTDITYCFPRNRQNPDNRMFSLQVSTGSESPMDLCDWFGKYFIYENASYTCIRHGSHKFAMSATPGVSPGRIRKVVPWGLVVYRDGKPVSPVIKFGFYVEGSTGVSLK